MFWIAFCAEYLQKIMRKKIETLFRHAPAIRANVSSLALVTSGFAVTRLLAFGTGVIIARIAGAATFGEFTLFVTVFTIVFTLGETLDTTFMRLASSPGAERDEITHHVVHIFAKIFYASCICIAGWVFAPILADLIIHKADSTPLIRAAVFAGGLVSIYNSIIGFYRRRQRFLTVAVLLPALNFIVFVVLVGVMLAGFQLNTDTLSLIYMLAAAGLSAGALIRLIVIWVSYSGGLKSGLVNFYRTAAPLMGAASLELIAVRLDVFFLASYVAYAELGHYGVALRIGAILAILTAAIRSVIVPKAASAIHDPFRLKRYMGVSAFYLAVFTIFAGILANFINPVIALLFGEEYLDISMVALLLVIQASLVTYAIPFNSMIQCGRNPGYLAYISAGRLVVTAFLLAALVPQYGLLGGAYATVISSVISLAAMLAVALTSAPIGTKSARTGLPYR